MLCYDLAPAPTGPINLFVVVIEGSTMFIAMNRFRVAKGFEAAFEQVWISRDSHLEKVPGFIEFNLLALLPLQFTRALAPSRETAQACRYR
jgi:hypothetical protein